MWHMSTKCEKKIKKNLHMDCMFVPKDREYCHNINQQVTKGQETNG
jgi:hypothetical protein